MDQAKKLPRCVAFGLQWSELNKIKRHIRTRNRISKLFWIGLTFGVLIGMSSAKIGVALLR